jgi:hypothetical protein
VVEKASYFSRFTTKFIEIVGAGIATAVSGYLVAHLGGYWSAQPPAPTPAAVQVAPSAGGGSANLHAPAARPVPADANAQRLAPGGGPDGISATPPPARATASSSQAAPSRKHLPTEAGPVESKPRDAGESKPRDTAEKPHEAAETKPHDWGSVEARVRAALASVDANRPVPPDPPARQADAPPEPAAVGTLPKPVDSVPGAGAVATLPTSVDAVPAAGAIAALPPRNSDIAPQPAQQAPVQPDPPMVEVKSLPVAAVEASPSPQPAADPKADAKENGQTADGGLFSVIKHIPTLLRHATLPPPDQAPRPPLPVGD